MQKKTEQNQSRIKPAEISLTQISHQGDSGVSPGRKVRKFIAWSGITCLALMVFAVIFVLPDWLQSNTPETSGVTTGAQNNQARVKTSPPSSAGSRVSPWTEAQLARQRKETQDILSEMLEKQEELEGLNVLQWADEEYSSALRLAETGDELYRKRQFIEAREMYQKGLDEFVRLLEMSENIFNDAVKKGYQAIDDGDSGTAGESFDLALLIKPEDRSAIRGRERAETLDDVLGLLEQGDSLLDENRYEEAETVFQKALETDPDMEPASRKLARTRQLITDRDFTAAMSGGFAKLDENRLQEALGFFQNALKIKPASQEARNALKQTENKLIVVKINNLLAQAQDAELSEAWKKAAELYEQALKLDQNLEVAQDGRQNAIMRNNLDQHLQYAIDNPLRLSDQSVYNETRSLYKQASAIASPGKKLQDQLYSLRTVLDKARKPVTVTFQSDNYTEITLYKTGSLGKFVTKQISLVPGRYVAAGTREGYQDVRVEFTVDPEKPMPPVIVQCDEEIAFGR